MPRQLPKIIAFCGKMGAGKTEAANYIAKKVNAERPVTVLKFAEPLYDITKFMCGRLKVSPDKNTLRPFMQYTGLYLRDAVGEDIFIRAFEARLKTIEDPETLVLCDDLRFTNEATMLRLLGANIVQVVSDKEVRHARGVDTSHEGHASEAGVDQEYISCDVFNNSTLQPFYNRLDKLYAALKTNKKV